MRSFEVITSGVNRSDGCLQPTQLGAASIRRASVCFPDDPDVVVAKVNRFGFVGRSFKQSVHIFAPGLKPSRNHKALLSAKLKQVRLDGSPREIGGADPAGQAAEVIPRGEPHNPSGLVFAVGVVNARDELTQRQRLPLVIDLHGMNIGQETARALWGVSLWGIYPPENRCQHGRFVGEIATDADGEIQRSPIHRSLLCSTCEQCAAFIAAPAER